MSTILKLIFIFSLGSSCLAQTGPLAHQSRGGRLSEYKPGTLGNFGLPDYPPKLVKIEKVNDSTTVLYYEKPFGQNYTQTLIKDEFYLNADRNIDSLKSIIFVDDSIQLIGFNTKPFKQVSRQRK